MNTVQDGPIAPGTYEAIRDTYYSYVTPTYGAATARTSAP